jgi:hypothetical protein
MKDARGLTEPGVVHPVLIEEVVDAMVLAAVMWLLQGMLLDVDHPALDVDHLEDHLAPDVDHLALDVDHLAQDTQDVVAHL